MDFINLRICVFFFVLISFVQASLKIFSPLNLIQRFSGNEIFTSIAYFGHVPWGKSLIGSVYHSQPGDACSFITSHYDNESSSSIIFADRGNCSYVKKAMYSQLAGAKMLIINDAYYEDTKEQIVNDDGNGDLINIPVLMVKKRDGDIIKEFLLSENKTIAKSVVLSISFELEKMEKVDLQIWLSTSNLESYAFVEEFHSLYLKLKEYINFQPFYALWFCAYCKHNQFKVKNDNCLSGGRYCYPDPDIDGPLLGKDYVKESLRQICIFKTNSENWWNYLNLYKTNCINSTLPEECTNILMNKTNIDKILVNKCILESFSGTDEDLDDNKLLKEDHERFKNEAIQIWPSILINNMIYKGTMDSSLIFEVICRSFTTPPLICTKEIDGLIDPINKQLNKYQTKKEKSNSNEINYTSILFLIIGVVIAFLLFMIMIKCKIFTRTELSKDISLNISSAVSRYFAFQDNKDKEKMIEVSA